MDRKAVLVALAAAALAAAVAAVVTGIVVGGYADAGDDPLDGHEDRRALGSRLRDKPVTVYFERSVGPNAVNYDRLHGLVPCGDATFLAADDRQGTLNYVNLERVTVIKVRGQ